MKYDWAAVDRIKRHGDPVPGDLVFVPKDRWSPSDERPMVYLGQDGTVQLTMGCDGTLKRWHTRIDNFRVLARFKDAVDVC